MSEAMKILMHDELTEAQRDGEMKGKREMALSLAAMGLSAEKIAEAAKVSVKMVQEWIAGGVSLAR